MALGWVLYLMVYAVLLGLYYFLAGGLKPGETTGDETAAEARLSRNRAGAVIPFLYGRSLVPGIYIDATSSSWQEHYHEEEPAGGK